MMSKKNQAISLMSCLLLGACVDIPPGAYYNHGDPENLLEVSSDTLRMELASQKDVNDLAAVVRDDVPTRAELECPSVIDYCAKAAKLLDERDIPASYTVDDSEHGPYGVVLVYERTVAHDCENRYIDNTRNNHNLSHPAFGCSITSNMVQMVTDKKQFTNPGLMDYPDAEKTVQAYGEYARPRTASEKSNDSGSSLLDSISSSSQ